MFARPRPKKSVLPPLSKKRKTTHAVEEISFDGNARAEYLTGFHKRKLQRIAHAQEEAAKKAREEKLELRKQVREDRKREVEEHVQQVEAILKEAERAGGVSDPDSSEEEHEEWDGIPDAPSLDVVDHEEEYIDEDKYTSVTIESVSVSKDGLVKPDEEQSGEEDGEDSGRETSELQQARKQKPSQPKKKKQKFRYETKYERQLNQRKQKAKRIKSRA